MANIRVLRNELQSDPLGRGYAGMSDQEAADSLNAVDRSRSVEIFTGDDLFNLTDGSEFASLTAEKKQLWIMFCNRQAITPIAGSANAAFVGWIFGNPSTTRSNIIAALTESISRANELGHGGLVKSGHVERARQ